jgi:hypothetical protein
MKKFFKRLFFEVKEYFAEIYDSLNLSYVKSEIKEVQASLHAANKCLDSERNMLLEELHDHFESKTRIEQRLNLRDDARKIRHSEARKAKHYHVAA